MGPALSRVTGTAVLLAGIAVGLWVVFGPPQEWQGEMRWARHGLALVSMGAIGLAARLVFPDTGSSGSGEAPG